jgi:hypothetical protein
MDVAQLPSSWAPVQTALSEMLADTSACRGLCETLETMLLEIIAGSGATATAAATMFGVSIPTWKRRLSGRPGLRQSA